MKREEKSRKDLEVDHIVFKGYSVKKKQKKTEPEHFVVPWEMTDQKKNTP